MSSNISPELDKAITEELQQHISIMVDDGKDITEIEEIYSEERRRLRQKERDQREL